MNQAESQRILDEYQRRAREIPADFYALHYPANLFLRHAQEAALLWGLRAVGQAPLAGRLLEIGCGNGNWFGLFESFGATPSRLAGIELGEVRCREAQSRFPQADIRQGDAAQLPWSHESFDLVFQSTVFTSILDDGVKRAVASEMLRVLKPNGAILWLDFRYGNPKNPHVRAIGRSEIRRLFPDCSIRLRRIMLAPPIARRVVPWSWKAAGFLQGLTLLNTHYFGVIRKRPLDD